jgi:hypothetical protein
VSGLIIVLIVWAALPAAAQTAVPRGDRILSIDLNVAEGRDYPTTFEMAQSMGIEDVNLSFDWRDLEPQPGQFTNEMFPIINLFYPAYGMPVSLFIRPISTGVNTMPEDLVGKRLDDPDVIARFAGVIDYTFEQTPDTQIRVIIIGSEIDAYLGSDADAWQQYLTFFKAARDAIKAKNPAVLVASEGLYAGMMGDLQPFFEQLHALADVIGVSYYPLNADFSPRSPDTVSADFAALLEVYPDQPVYFFQLGCPSSPEIQSSEELQAEFITLGTAGTTYSKKIQSSEELQAEFIRQVFAAWDQYADRIKYIKFTWLYDVSAATVSFFETYYSYSAPGFAAYLGSLGLHYQDGTPKLAFAALQEEVRARGW